MLLFCVGETDDWMSELLAIFSISSDVGMLIGLSSKVAESNRLVTLGALVALKVDILNTLKVQPRYAF